MLARRWLVTVVLACCAAVAMPAHGASTPPPGAVVAHDGKVLAASDDEYDEAVVAQDGDVRLGASDGEFDDSLCIAIRSRHPEHRMACGDPALGAVTLPEQDAAGPRHVGAAVPQPAVRVEIRRGGRIVASGPAVVGTTYTGKSAGAVRFALVALPAGAPTDALRVHALDGAGASVAVLGSFGDDQIFERRRLLSGRSAGVRWSIVSHLRSALAPTVFDPAHETIARCLAVRIPGEPTYLDKCESEPPSDDVLFGDGVPQVAVKDRCGSRFRLVYGLVAADVRRVTLVLGNGRRQTARTAPFGASGPLTYALSVQAGLAVRSLVLQLHSGATRVVPVTAAPLAVACASRSLGNLQGSGGDPARFAPPADVPAVVPAGPVATLPSTPPVRLADGPGETLCLAIGDRPFDADACALVPPGLRDPLFLYGQPGLGKTLLTTLDSFRNPRALALVVPARVVTVRIAGPNGAGTRDIPTVPVAPYAGRYAGHVRVAATAISGYRQLTRFELLDAAGTILHSERDSSVASFAGLGSLPARRPRRGAVAVADRGALRGWDDTLHVAHPRPASDSADRLPSGYG